VEILQHIQSQILSLDFVNQFMTKCDAKFLIPTERTGQARYATASESESEQPVIINQGVFVSK
jgi:hypothetical protein